MKSANHNFNFWQKWLTYANALTVIIGLLVAFAGNSIVFEIHNEYNKKVFFNGNTFSEEILPFKNWLFGIIGGTIVGFHLLMIMTSEHATCNKLIWCIL